MDHFQLESEQLFETQAHQHTSARGIEEFDKVYGLGYQVDHADWSPFPRVNQLYWSNGTGHFIERQSMLINEVLYDRKTYL